MNKFIVKLARRLKGGLVSTVKVEVEAQNEYHAAHMAEAEMGKPWLFAEMMEPKKKKEK